MPIFYDPDIYRISSKRVKRSTLFDMARRTWDDDVAGASELESDAANMEGSELPRKYLATNSMSIGPTSDQGELMDGVKNGDSLKWVPNQALEDVFAEQKDVNQFTQPPDLGELHVPAASVSTAQILGNVSPWEDHRQASSSPDDIDRPRSALHAGDFRNASSQHDHVRRRVPTEHRVSDPRHRVLDSSIAMPWGAPSPIASLTRFHTDPQILDQYSRSTDHFKRARGSSLGSSHSSSFVMRAPTSPLVHSANNADLDFSPRDDLDSVSLNKPSRRRTLPPETFRALQSSLDEDYQPIANLSRPFPYQAHQPRRSLSSFTYQPAMSPKTPSMPRSRMPSFSEVSPIQHAAMVGSFEESILRGRMSTAPSKPLDFVAQIGVLGKGDCKPHLRCPAHVTVPFPAVFYSYPSVSGNRSFSDDSPSPYVGTIDLEHSLNPIEVSKQRKNRPSSNLDLDTHMRDLTAPENTPIGRDLEWKQRQKRRRTVSPKAPSGGCYRVPQQGQLQIVIKNPNKTAVKLYLIPYDLEGMEAGTKTFVRQRSFSAGPIIEKPLTDKPESTLPVDPLKDKLVLRYLVHLKFCCPSKGRFYLYDNIRVVFANRVPDGKEKLRNEIQLPDPRYSAYKSGRDSSIGSVGAKLAAEKARRRSVGFGNHPGAFDAMDGISSGQLFHSIVPPPVPQESAIQFRLAPEHRNISVKSEPVHAMTIQSLPHHAARQPTFFSKLQDDPTPERTQTLSPKPGFNPSTSARGSPIPWGSGSGGSGGRSFSPEVGESLLAQKLRGLDVQRFGEEPHE